MHRHLIGIVLASMTLLLVALVVPLTMLIGWNAEHRVVAAATQQAIVLASTAGSLTDGSLPTEPREGVATTVFLPDGRVVGVPAARTPSVEQAARCVPSTTEVGSSVEVLVPVTAPGGCSGAVRMLVGEQALHRGRGTLILVVLSVSAGLVLFGALLAERLGGGLLRSVRDLATAADRMATGDLDARATPGGPAEIRSASAQLNMLAIRVDGLLNEQRQRGADIAHRLRTPLTSLRLDIDTVPDEPSKRRLTRGHDAVIAALDEVIRTSQRPDHPEPSTVTDLVGVVRARAAYWSVLARSSGRTVHLDVAPGPLLVPVGQASLEAALDALFGNVFAHTDAGVSVWLLARRRPTGAATLIVDDSGPGFGNLDIAHRGRSAGGSTGLGLDIARRTVEETEGEFRLGISPQGGARVELRFALSS